MKTPELRILLGLLITALSLSACKEGGNLDSSSDQKDLDCVPVGEEIIFSSQLHLDGTWNKVMNPLNWNIWRFAPDGSQATPLTDYSDAHYSRIPVISPSGKYIIYSSNVNLNGKSDSPKSVVFNLWVSTRDGKKKWPVTKNTVSPLSTYYGMMTRDDKYILFHSNLNLSGKWDDPINPTNNIWVIDREGKTAPRAITANSLPGLDSFVRDTSPDGKWISGRSYMNLSGKFDDPPVLSPNIWLMSFDGKERRALTKNTLKLRNSSGGMFFPDGSRVSFISVMSLTGVWDAPGSGKWTIWSIKTDGTDLKLIAGNEKMGFYYSAISNDSKTIYGASPRHFDGVSPDYPSANIWAINADGSGMVPLTFNTNAKLNSYAPRLSPSGKELVFISLSDLTGAWNGKPTASFNVWRMKTDGSDRAPLTLNDNPLLDTSMDMPVDWAPAQNCK